MLGELYYVLDHACVFKLIGWVFKSYGLVVKTYGTEKGAIRVQFTHACMHECKFLDLPTARPGRCVPPPQSSVFV
jgi:hypothetical protein